MVDHHDRQILIPFLRQSGTDDASGAEGEK